MLTATKTFTFDCAHRLPYHEGLCKNIHGHTYKVDVTVEGGRQGRGPEDGMIIDFKRLKTICNKLFNKYDHAYVCSVEDREVLRFMKDQEFKVVEFPCSPTAESMAQVFYDQLDEALKDEHINIRAITVWETPTSYATFQ